MNIEQGLRIENENLKRLLEETERERDNLQIMVDANLRVNGHLRTLAIKDGYNPAGHLNELEYLLKRFDEIKQERDEALAYAERVRNSLHEAWTGLCVVRPSVYPGDLKGLQVRVSSALSEQQPAALAALKDQWQSEALYQCVKSCKLKVFDGPDMYSDAVLSFAKDLHQCAQEAAQPCTYPDCRCPIELPHKDSPCAIGRKKEPSNG